MTCQKPVEFQDGENSLDLGCCRYALVGVTHVVRSCQQLCSDANAPLARTRPDPGSQPELAGMDIYRDECAGPPDSVSSYW